MNTVANITSAKSNKPTSSDSCEPDRKAPTDLSSDKLACTQAKSAEAKSQNLNGQEPLTTALTPISAGLSLILVRDPSQLPSFRYIMTHAALKKSTAFGLLMPDVPCVLSLHARPAHRIAMAQVLASLNRETKTGIKHRHQTIKASNHFDWTSYAGSAVLCPIIEKAKGWVIVEQPVLEAESCSREAGLSKIHAVAKEHGVWVMLFITNTSSKMGKLSDSRRGHMIYTDCEPDSEYSMVLID